MRMRPGLIAVFAMCAAACVAGLVPELLTANFYRTNVVASVYSDSYYKGTTLRLTNCIAFASGGVTQDLTSCGVIVTVGDSATNRTVYGAIQDAPNGTFTADALIPPVGGKQMRVELMLTNGATLYIYPAYTIDVEAPL